MVDLVVHEDVARFLRIGLGRGSPRLDAEVFFGQLRRLIHLDVLDLVVDYVAVVQTVRIPDHLAFLGFFD